MEPSIKTRLTGIQAQQARETRAPWTDTSVNERPNLLLKEIIYWDSNAAS